MRVYGAPRDAHMDRASGSHGKGMLVVMCITPASAAASKAKTVKAIVATVMNLCIDMKPSGSHQSYALVGGKGFG